MQHNKINPNVLFVDDDISRYLSFTQNNHNSLCAQDLHFTKCPFDAIDMLRNAKLDIIFLDYDLPTNTDNSITSLAIAQYIADNPQYFTDQIVVIHSANPIGVARLMDMLKYVTLQLYVIPNAWYKSNLIDFILNQQ